MTRWLFDSLPWFAEQLSAKERAAVMLDFDGTLAPIVEDPEAAMMPDATRSVLSALVSSERGEVALISGRSIRDLEERAGLDEIYYAGNHGLEIRHGNQIFLAPGAAAASALLEPAAEALRARLAPIAGTLVENKGLTLSIHSRRVAREHLPELERRVASVFEGLRGRMNLRRGSEVFEISPRIDWDKGKAAVWILDRIGRRAALPIYIGDDTTDEDAFVALREGVTVRVGASQETAARFHVRDTAEVRECLEWICARLRGRRQTHGK